MLLLEDLLSCLKTVYAPYHSTLLGLSGGADSVSLFYLLLEYQKYRKDFLFHTFYLNHNMPDNQEYNLQCLEFTKKLSQQYKVPFHTESIAMQDLKIQTHQSYEDIGREARYHLSKKIINTYHLESISLAHHKDDLTETMLMRLFSGGSPSSFMGMSQDRNNILRPLLFIHKKQLLEFLSHYHYNYLEDPTNKDTKYKRNYTRYKIIPQIKEYFPLFDNKLLQFYHLLESQNNIIKNLLPKWESIDKGVFISLRKLENLDPYLIKESIKLEIRTLCPKQYLTFHQLEKIVKFVLNKNYKEKKNILTTKYIHLIKEKGSIICSIIT